MYQYLGNGLFLVQDWHQDSNFEPVDVEVLEDSHWARLDAASRTAGKPSVSKAKCNSKPVKNAKGIVIRPATFPCGSVCRQKKNCGLSKSEKATIARRTKGLDEQELRKAIVVAKRRKRQGQAGAVYEATSKALGQQGKQRQEKRFQKSVAAAEKRAKSKAKVEKPEATEGDWTRKLKGLEDLAASSKKQKPAVNPEFEKYNFLGTGEGEDKAKSQRSAVNAIMDGVLDVLPASSQRKMNTSSDAAIKAIEEVMTSDRHASIRDKDKDYYDNSAVGAFVLKSLGVTAPKPFSRSSPAYLKATNLIGFRLRAYLDEKEGVPLAVLPDVPKTLSRTEEVAVYKYKKEKAHNARQKLIEKGYDLSSDRDGYTVHSPDGPIQAKTIFDVNRILDSLPAANKPKAEEPAPVPADKEPVKPKAEEPTADPKDKNADIVQLRQYARNAIGKGQTDEARKQFGRLTESQLSGKLQEMRSGDLSQDKNRATYITMAIEFDRRQSEKLAKIGNSSNPGDVAKRAQIELETAKAIGTPEEIKAWEEAARDANRKWQESLRKPQASQSSLFNSWEHSSDMPLFQTDSQDSPGSYQYIGNGLFLVQGWHQDSNFEPVSIEDLTDQHWARVDAVSRNSGKAPVSKAKCNSKPVVNAKGQVIRPATFPCGSVCRQKKNCGLSKSEEAKISRHTKGLDERELRKAIVLAKRKKRQGQTGASAVRESTEVAREGKNKERMERRYQKTLERAEKRAKAKADLEAKQQQLEADRKKAWEQTREKAASKVASGRPGSIGEIAPDQIDVDPKRFQYKVVQTNLATGEVGSLGGVNRYDPNLGGLIQVWKDPADDRTYVVNGHNRLALAKRLGAENVAVRYLDVPDAQTARAVGALTNIAEGRGTAVDAAKFFRDSGFTKDDLEKKGIPMREKIATDGLSLANLDDSIFRQVIDGRMTIDRASRIGCCLSDPTEQQKLVEMIEKRESSGRKSRLTNEAISELIDTISSSESKTEEQFDLFGSSTVTQNLAIEKAELQAATKRRLARDKKLFGTVGKSTSAERLSQAGNVIDVDSSQKISQEASVALSIFDQLKNQSGPVSTLLNEAARRIADGESRKKVEAELYAKIQSDLPALVGLR